MDSKIKIPFENILNEKGYEELRKLSKDSDVKEITVLPSFKNKRNRLRSGKRVIRCDDTVIRCTRGSPKYCDYQIGCGFIVFKFFSDMNLQGIQETLSTVFKEYSKGFSTPSLSTRDSYFKNSLEKSDNVFSRICSGTEGIKEFLNASSIPINYDEGSLSNNLIDPIRITELLKEEWLYPQNKLMEWGGFKSLTGSHYLDILRSESNENEYYVHVHACGLQFSDICSEDINDQILNDALSETDFYTLTNFIKNFSTLRRTLLTCSLFTKLTQKMNDLNVTFLIDQTHHDLEKLENGDFTYYNDSQKISDDKLVILPSGYANIPSYLIRTGSNLITEPEAISHNLKLIIKHDKKRALLEEYTLVCEASKPSRIQRLFSKKWVVRTMLKHIEVSPDTENLVVKLKRNHKFEEIEKIFPIFRFHIRRSNEKPFIKGFPTL